MSNHKCRITMYVLPVAAVLVLIGSLASEGRGDFVLWDDEEFTVDINPAGVGTLYDRSRVRVVSGGHSSRIYAYDQSSVTVSDGIVSRVDAYHTSSVEMSGGVISSLYARDAASVNMSGGTVYGTFSVSNSSTANISDGSIANLDTFGTADVDISGGSMDNLYTRDSSTVSLSGVSVDDVSVSNSSSVSLSGLSMDDVFAYDSSSVSLSDVSMDELTAASDSSVEISGGSMDDVFANGTMSMSGCTVGRLFARGDSVVEILDTVIGTFYAQDRSTTTFTAREFRLGDGLTLDVDRLLGTGRLSYESYDGTRHLTVIENNHSGATILLIPEPATLSLLTLGGMAVVRRRKRRACK